MSTHTVKSGDTLFSIARQYGLTVDELKSINSLKTNTIRLGQVLKVKKVSFISSATPTPSTPSATHTVKSGDTLFGLSRRYGISVEALRTLNSLKTNDLRVGQVLKLGKTTATSTSNPSTSTTTKPSVQPSTQPTLPPVYDDVLNRKIQFGVSFTGGTITGMTNSETRAYAANVAYTESRFRAQVENEYGYMGLYQFGAVALVEAGLISRTKYNEAVRIHGSKLANGANAAIHKAFIADSSNWVAGYNKQIFLNNVNVQHKAFVTYTNNNIQYATAAAKRVMQGNIAKIAAYMKMAHLLGPYRASEGTVNPKFDAADKNQTSMQEYGLGVANEIRTLSKWIENALR